MTSVLSAHLITLNDSDDTTSTPLSTTASPSSSSPIGPVTASRSSTTSSTLTMSPVVQTASVSTDNDDGSKDSSKPVAAGLIVGILLLVFVVIGLTLFFVRRYFIRRREHKTNPTRARLSRLVISEPANFQHLGTGRVNVAAGEGGSSQISGFTISNPNLPSRENLRDEDVVWDREETPRDKGKPKYSYDFGALESGLSDHVEAMRKQQKPPTRI